ncbi:MAG: 50S ribosomal protein L17 [Candidatus Pacebacteria bacterium]|nr:50S ribosomal protein L17 [Candidatus Paceibacterota bacterium]
MRHHNRNKKFGRVRKQRKALLSSLARSLVLKEKIETSEVKAKALRPLIERLVTHGKKGTVAARRTITTRIGKEGTKKLVDVLTPKYNQRKGGYTRIVKLPRRLSDDSSRAIIEFV